MRSQKFTMTFFILGEICLSLSHSAHALLLSPMSASLSPTGDGATRSFELTNQFDKSIAVQLSVAERIQESNGKETIKKSSEISKSFVLFPASFTLKPREKRVVRLAWRGDSQLDRELNYRLIAEQLPISGEREKTSNDRSAMVNLLMKYIAAVYITPSDARPQIEIIQTRRDKSLMKLRIKNIGKKHQILRKFSLQWDGGSISHEQLRELSGQNILAGQERDFEFTWPKSMATTAKNYRLVIHP